MRVLDLFSGLGGWSQPFKDRGHEVFRVDNNPSFDADVVTDILKLEPSWFGWKPDIILASPPCTSFSMMSVGTHWTKDGRPKSDTAKMGLALVVHTMAIIRALDPRVSIIENPRARLRTLGILDSFERRTVTYCQYGEKRMKPTDLWGGFPPSLVLKPMCKNGDPCHVRAPRGSQTGSQGMDSAESAKIPYALALAVCLATERDLGE